MVLDSYAQKIFWGAERKMPRSKMEKCYFPISDQLLIQFEQILFITEQILAHFGPWYFLVGDPNIFLSE